MGEVIKFQRKKRPAFDCKAAAKELIDFAENIKSPLCDGDVDNVLIIFRQGGNYCVGGWGEVDAKEKVKIIAELKRYFVDIGV